MARLYADEQYPYPVVEFLITQNRQDFFRLHRIQPDHAGIIACTNDRNWEALANRIHEAIALEESLSGKLIRIVRPAI